MRVVSGLAGLAAALWVALAAATPAAAHGGDGEGPPDAATWVQQAIAFLDLTPPNVGEAAERVEGALAAKDATGVDLALVREAQAALARKDVASAAAALTRALEAPAPAVAQPPAGTTAQAPPAATPDAVSDGEEEDDVPAHYRPGAPLKALEPRFEGSGVEYTLLAVGVVLAGLGMFGLRSGDGRAREARR